MFFGSTHARLVALTLITTTLISGTRSQLAHATELPAASPTDAQDEVIDLIRQNILAYFYTGQFEARMHQACANFSNETGYPWFHSNGIDSSRARLKCATSISELKRSIRRNWSPMRIALSLSKPTYREERLTSSISTKFAVKVSHPFSAGAEMPRLNDYEQAEALRQFDVEIARLRAEFRENRLKISKKHGTSPVLLSSDEDQFVIRSLDSFRAKMEDRYLTLVAENPMLALVDNAEPSDQALAAAFGEIAKNAETVIGEIQSSDLGKDTELLGNYTSFIDSVLKERPDLAPAIAQLKQRIIEENRSRQRAEQAFVVLLMFGTFMADMPAILITYKAAKIGYKFYSVLRTRSEELEQKAIFFSAVTRSKGITHLEKMSELHRNAVLAQVLLPIAVFGINSTFDLN